MDKAIQEMKEDVYRIYADRRAAAIRKHETTRDLRQDILQAAQAYAALCQAEAMERMDSPQVTVGKSLHTHLFVPDDTLNRGDQSIADAISEQVMDPPDEPWDSDHICREGHQHGSEVFQRLCDEKVAE